jgi:hypothetical protein
MPLLYGYFWTDSIRTTSARSCTRDTQAANGGPAGLELDTVRPWLSLIAIKDMQWTKDAIAGVELVGDGTRPAMVGGRDGAEGMQVQRDYQHPRRI